MKVGVDHLFVEGNAGRRRGRGRLMSGECSDFIGADGGVDRRLDGNGSGEGKHERRWISEVVDKRSGCLWKVVFIRTKNPLLLLPVNNVGKTSVCGDAYW